MAPDTEPELVHVFVEPISSSGFHRAGRFWPPGVYTEADVTHEQLAALETEPRLRVHRQRPEDPGALEHLTAEMGRARAERDAARAEVAKLSPQALANNTAMQALQADIAKLTAERDAARAEVAKLTADLSSLTEPPKPSKK